MYGLLLAVFPAKAAVGQCFPSDQQLMQKPRYYFHYHYHYHYHHYN